MRDCIGKVVVNVDSYAFENIVTSLKVILAGFDSSLQVQPLQAVRVIVAPVMGVRFDLVNPRVQVGHIVSNRLQSQIELLLILELSRKFTPYLFLEIGKLNLH